MTHSVYVEVASLKSLNLLKEIFTQKLPMKFSRNMSVFGKFLNDWYVYLTVCLECYLSAVFQGNFLGA